MTCPAMDRNAEVILSFHMASLKPLFACHWAVGRWVWLSSTAAHIFASHTMLEFVSCSSSCAISSSQAGFNKAGSAAVFSCEVLIQGFPNCGCGAALWGRDHPSCPLLCLPYPQAQCRFPQGVRIRLRTVPGLAMQFGEPTWT